MKEQGNACAAWRFASGERAVILRPNSARHDIRLYIYPDKPIHPEANFAAGQADNTRVTGPEHLDSRAATYAKFFQTMDVVGRTKHPTYERRLTNT